MSGKNAKMLRRLASKEDVSLRDLKRNWLRTSHKGRGQARPVVDRILGKPKR